MNFTNTVGIMFFFYISYFVFIGKTRDIEALVFDVKALQQELAKEKQARAKLEKGVTALQEQIAAFQTREDDASPIAFSVYSEENFGPVTEFTNIPFPFVRVNVGEGWNPEEDAFQAPVAGYYYVFASIACLDEEHPHVRIRHHDSSGSRTVAGLISTSSTVIGDANGAVLYLDEGDSVTVELSNSGDGITYSSAAGRYTTFSGFRL